VKNIFAKLNVERRAQAVSRAQSLGLAGTRKRSPEDEHALPKT